MAAGITARQYTNNAVFSKGTVFFNVAANVVPGTAEDLIGKAVDAMGGLPSAILLSNNSASTVWIKGSHPAWGAGAGVAISSLGSMFFPIAGVPDAGIYLENANDLVAIAFE